jgi:hypothetical protein
VFASSNPARPKPSRLRRIVRLLCWSLAGPLTLVLAGLCFPHWFLQVETRAERADVIVILGGEPVVRVDRAVQLFRAGLAPKIRQLLDAGVPRSAIVAERTSRSTLENARNCSSLFVDLNAKRVVIVTSWYHSRRALACFEHTSPDLQILSLPSRSRDATPRHFILNEYLKLGYYAVEHGVWPVGL